MTTITLDGAAIGAGAAAELPPITLEVGPGAPWVVAVETDERPMLLSMLLGGRMRATAGRVVTDRRRVALVDTPFVSEPVPSVALRTVVREELAFAGGRTSRRAVEATLERFRLSERADAPVRVLPTSDRLRLLVALAFERPGVDAVVLTSPERHGGEPSAWFPAIAALTADEHADRTLVIVTDAPTRDRLVALGARDASTPLPAEPVLAAPASSTPSEH